MENLPQHPADLTGADLQQGAAMPDDLQALADEAAQHPGTPAPLRELLPRLVGIVAQLQREAHRAPCEGCSGPRAMLPVELQHLGGEGA